MPILQLWIWFTLLIIYTESKFINSSINGDLYELLNENPKKYESLERVLSFAFTSHRCVQVTTDESPMAFEIMSLVYSTSSRCSFINGVNIKMKTCNGYLLISKYLKDILRLLKRIPLLYDHRIVCLVGAGHHKRLNKFIYEARNIFKDSEALLVIFGNDPLFFQRKQPHNVLQPLKYPIGYWHQKEFGVDNFHGKEITVGIFNCTVFSELSQVNETGQATWVRGAELYLLTEMFLRLNLTYKIKVPTGENKWGKLIDGKWSGGVIKLLSKGDVDIAGCGIWTVWPIIASGIDMSFPLGQICYKMIVPRPQLLNTNWQEIFSLFRYDLWIFILVLICLATIFLHGFTKITSSFDKCIRGHSLLKCLFLVLSVLLLSGVPRTKQGALRQLVTWIVILSLVLSTCFSGGLISHLTTPRYSKKIDTVENLVKNNFNWIEKFVPDLTILFDRDDYWQKEWATKLLVVHSNIESERLMRTGKVVMYGQQFENGFFLEEYYSPDVMDTFEAATECTNKFFFSFANRKGSPFALPLRKYIHRFHNGGIIQRVMHKSINQLAPTNPYMKEVLHFTKSKMGLPIKLTLANLSGAFFVWGTGLVISSIVFLVEKYIKR